jgi:hypothetical protein
MSPHNAAKPAAEDTANGLRDSKSLASEWNLAPTQPQQQAPAAIIAGQHVAHLEIIALDSTGKRLLARCVCGRALPLSTEAVAQGVVTSCGCRPPPLLNRDAFREELARQQRQREMAP